MSRHNDPVYFVSLGGGSSIGASCYLVRAGDTTVLIDCGIHPEKHPGATFDLILERAQESGLVSSLADISAFVLSHAHTDHSGLVPALYRYCRQARSGHVPYFYMTVATKHLLPYVWRNVLRFSPKAPYDEADVHNVLQHIKVPGEGGCEIDWLRPELGGLRLHANSHLLGSAMIELDIAGRTLLHTGDLRLGASPTLAASGPPECRPDIMIIDSTYAAANARPIASWENVRAGLFEILDRFLSISGTVLFPCFAMGRAQDVLGLVLEYGEQHPDLLFYVYLDGQSREITLEMLTAFGGLLTPEYTALVDRNRWRLRPVAPDCSLEQLLSREVLGYPSVVIASSGMLLPGSASRRWADLLARGQNATIGITGYLDEEMHEELFVRNVLGDQALTLPVNALPISGHMSASDTLQLVTVLQPESVILVHCGSGDLTGPGSLLQKLVLAGFPTSIGNDGNVMVV